MTDYQTLMADFAAREAERTAQARLTFQHLKRAVIDPLRTGGITRVEIRFDGYGDSGAVEECVFFDATGSIASCPDMTIEPMAGNDAVPDRQTLDAALEQLAYLALERHHPGWEINEGACGELVIDVAAPSFVLACQLRYTATDDHSTDL
ncbi:DUF6878 family protein [Croceicoccus hydrothermalis]|uniref:DUF6878 family protein n=1 Tax=Croceicoccus hydrothermalis TaxID=2867964 RepID=UPI001EFC0679|nr:DUF6878 family protein [Croceicoccus hydrothermalis]